MKQNRIKRHPFSNRISETLRKAKWTKVAFLFVSTTPRCMSNSAACCHDNIALLTVLNTVVVAAAFSFESIFECLR